MLDVSSAASDAMLDTIGGMLDGGNLEVLSPNSELLVTMGLSNPGAAVDGELVFKVGEGVAVLTGEARFARAVAPDGNVVFSCDVGPEGSEAVIRLTPTQINRGAPVRLDNLRLVMP